MTDRIVFCDFCDAQAVVEADFEKARAALEQAGWAVDFVGKEHSATWVHRCPDCRRQYPHVVAR